MKKVSFNEYLNSNPRVLGSFEDIDWYEEETEDDWYEYEAGTHYDLVLAGDTLRVCHYWVGPDASDTVFVLTEDDDLWTHEVRWLVEWIGEFGEWSKVEPDARLLAWALQPEPMWLGFRQRRSSGDVVEVKVVNTFDEPDEPGWHWTILEYDEVKIVYEE